MKNLKISLYAMTLVSLVFVLAPSTALAQDQGVPPCCIDSLATHGHAVDSIFSRTLRLAASAPQVSVSPQGVAIPHVASSFEGQIQPEAAVPGIMLSSGNREVYNLVRYFKVQGLLCAQSSSFSMRV